MSENKLKLINFWEKQKETIQVPQKSIIPITIDWCTLKVCFRLQDLLLTTSLAFNCVTVLKSKELLKFTKTLNIKKRSPRIQKLRTWVMKNREGRNKELIRKQYTLIQRNGVNSNTTKLPLTKCNQEQVIQVLGPMMVRNLPTLKSCFIISDYLRSTSRQSWPKAKNIPLHNKKAKWLLVHQLNSYTLKAIHL